jgi:hypothetical protein
MKPNLTNIEKTQTFEKQEKKNRNTAHPRKKANKKHK